MWLLLKYTLLYASVLALVALGGMFSERSGVINIALEGTLLTSAFFAFLTQYFVRNIFVAVLVAVLGLIPILGTIISAVVGRD